MSDDYKTGKVIENPDFVNVSKYVTMPKSVEYKLTGFVNKPEIKIYNASGSEVTANVDAKGNVSAVSYTHLDVYKRQGNSSTVGTTDIIHYSQLLWKSSEKA